MALIPQVDIVVNLSDTGYSLPVVTEGDLSTTLGVFGLYGVNPGTSGCMLGDVKAVAQFPFYNSAFGPTPEPNQNFSLGVSRTDYTVTTGAPFTQQANWNDEAGLICILDTGDINATGEIRAKILPYPADLDYTTVGMVPLVIANQSSDMGFACIMPIVFDDAAYGFCISANTNGFGSLPAGSYILLVKNDLSTSGWLPDDMKNNFNIFATCSWLSNGINYQADQNFLPTLSVYTLTYNFLTGETITLLGTGDVSTDASNAFGAPGNPQNSSSIFITQNGIFGIDSTSGNDTGCWYCALDCSAFGTVTFVMPDASIGPSSSQTVWQNFNGTLSFRTYPQTDNAGNWWWIRLPLCDGGGAMIVDANTSRVYTSSAPAPVALRPPNYYPYIIPPVQLPWDKCLNPWQACILER